jgi:hypothetical protein
LGKFLKFAIFMMVKSPLVRRNYSSTNKIEITQNNTRVGLIEQKVA